MNRTIIVEGNFREMVVMGDDRDFEREQSNGERKSGRKEGWKI